jgi:hypothetical protein
MVMRSYCLVILKYVAQRVPWSAFFCVFGDMIMMRKANSGFFTGVTTESWIRSGLWRPSPQACLSSRPNVYRLIRMPGSWASHDCHCHCLPVTVQPLIWSGQVQPSVPSLVAELSRLKNPFTWPSETEIRASNPGLNHVYLILVFRRVRKFTKRDNSIRHVRPSAWKNSAHAGRILVIFHTVRKSVEKFVVWRKSDKNNGHSHDDLRTFIISRTILLRMSNISDKVVQKTKTHFISNNFCP